MSTARIQTPDAEFEGDLDRTLRPRMLADFVGQPGLKEQLSVSLEAAASRNEALDHVLLAGPPGLGKTSLAQIVAAELDVPFVQTAGPALERKGDIAAFLTALEPRSVFFVDEIHRLPRALEETFYPAMEDRQLPITVGQGAGRAWSRSTCRSSPWSARPPAPGCSRPLRDRFGIQHRLEHYEPADLAAIVRRLRRDPPGVTSTREGATAIASRSRGTPRVANRLLKRVRDYAEVRSDGVIDAACADAALNMLEVDDLGLDRLDRELLRAICEKFGGGPVGLSTLAVTVGEEQDTIERCSRSRIYFSAVSSSEPRAGVSRPHAPSSTSALKPPRTERSFKGEVRRSFSGRSAYPFDRDGAPVHLSQLRQPDYRRSQCRIPPSGSFLREVRLRLSLRVARRLLPGSRRGVLRLRPRWQRVIAARGAALLELTGLDDQKVIGRKVGDVLGLKFDDDSADPVETVLEWGVRKPRWSARRGASMQRAICPPKPPRTCSRLMTMTAGCC